MPIIQTKYELKSLGDPKRGIILGAGVLRLKAQGPFRVSFDPETGIVNLENHNASFQVVRQEGKHYLVLWGQPCLFEPFLKLTWMESMLDAPRQKK